MAIFVKIAPMQNVVTKRDWFHSFNVSFSLRTPPYKKVVTMHDQFPLLVVFKLVILVKIAPTQLFVTIHD